MAKIKTTRLEPRTSSGSLTIGNDEGPSTTQFEGTVIIPDYATVDYVDHIVAGDIAIELGAYQQRDEKNQNAGYAGLDDTGRVPADRIDTDVLVAEVDEHHEQIATNTQKIAQLEATKIFQVEYYLANKSGGSVSTSYMSINADTWEDTTQIKLNQEDADGAIHDFSAIKQNDAIWFADITFEDNTREGVDTYGLFIVNTITIADSVATFVVTANSARGAPTVLDRIEAEVFPAFDVSSKANITYVDSQDNWIKDNYLPLSGSTGHKMTGDIYAAQHTIKGLSDPVDGGDAVSRNYGDDRYLKKDGTNKMSGDLDANNYDINNVSRINLTGDRTIDAANGVAGMLQYNGQDKFKWGSSWIWAYEDLDMQFNYIKNLKPPTDANDAVTKTYVDEMETIPIEIGTSAAPPSRPKGSMYLTTGGNVYVYT